MKMTNLASKMMKMMNLVPQRWDGMIQIEDLELNFRFHLFLMSGELYVVF